MPKRLINHLEAYTLHLDGVLIEFQVIYQEKLVELDPASGWLSWTQDHVSDVDRRDHSHSSVLLSGGN